MDFQNLQEESKKTDILKQSASFKEKNDDVLQADFKEEDQLFEKKETVVEQLEGRKTMTDTTGLKLDSIPVEDKLSDVKERMSWNTSSATAEKRKEYLLNGKPVSEEAKAAYIKEYQQQEEEVRKYRSMPEIFRDIKANFQKMRELRDMLNEDTDSASDSFVEMKTSVNKLLLMIDGETGESTFDYQEAYARAKKATAAYREKRSGHRFTDKGKRRKDIAKKILAQFEQREESFVMLLREAKWQEISSGENEKTATRREQIGDAMFNGQTKVPQMSESKVKKIAEKGTIFEKMKSAWEIEQHRQLSDKYGNILDKNGMKFDEKKTNKLDNTIWDSINNVSALEKLEAYEIILSMQSVILNKIKEAYHNYKENAPDGVNPEAYAALKIRNDPLCIQKGALDQVKFQFSTGVSGQSDDVWGTDLSNMLKQMEATMSGKEEMAEITGILEGVHIENKFITAVGKEQYKEIAKEAQTEELKQFLNSKSVTKDKTKKSRKIDAGRAVDEQLEENAFKAKIKELDENGGEDFVKEIKTHPEMVNTYSKGVGVLGYNEDGGIINGEEVGVNRKALADDKGRIVKAGTPEEKIAVLSMFILVKDNLRTEYQQFTEQVVDSIAHASAKEKVELAKELFRLKIASGKALVGNAHRDTNISLTYFIANVGAGEEICQMVSEKLNEVAPEIVKLAEKMETAYLEKNEEFAQKRQEAAEHLKERWEKLKADRKLGKDFTIRDQMLKFSSHSRKSYKDQGFIRELESYSKAIKALKDFIAEAHNEPMYSGLNKAVNEFLALPEITDEIAEKMKPDDYMPYNIALEKINRMLRNTEYSFAEKKTKQIFENYEIEMNPSDFIEDSEVVRADLKLGDIAQTFINETMAYVAECKERMNGDEAAKQQVEEMKKEILSENIEKVNLETVNAVVESGDLKKQLAMLFEVKRGIQKGSLMFGNATDKAKTTTALYDDDMSYWDGKPSYYRDLIQEKLSTVSTYEFAQIFMVIEELSDELILKVQEEYQQFLKEAPDGVDPSLYAYTKLRFSETSINLMTLEQVVIDWSRSNSRFLAIYQKFDAKIKNAPIKGGENAMEVKISEKMSNEIILSLRKETNWDERVSAFKEKYAKILMPREEFLNRK